MAQPNTRRRDVTVAATAGIIVLFVAQVVTRTYQQVPAGVWNYCIGVTGGIVGFIASMALFNKFVFDPLERNSDGPVWKAFTWMGIAFVVVMGVTLGTTWLAQELFAK
ncbi:hypothetical protein QFZ60_001582 [Arthrobacter sp. B2I5]|uniref:hypothetical protein n=1 Tax=Arthrobacter sp. B2I5 TaxID=3042266 RepID=UPI002781A5A9|nr:hypothetical protein [Arthrobacter sp. B2I5]MDQ0825409.1 hypothetical protein [Arthrobacter sp. B2I5]